ncbi:MAG TPA: SPOR domain-containing protein [Sphingomicrobium sp.]|nr:SPOR domain-containing protein [Sphingomicrobium sp.]
MRSSYLAASIWLASLAAPLSAQSVKAGIDAWQKADYSAAVAIWRPLAEKGDADAQFNLGQAYRLGRGVPIDIGAAQLWFERAAARGHLDAQTTLGLLLFQNGNHTGAVRWLKAASDKDEPRAMLVYGTALFNGDGVPQDPVQGYAYITRAAARGLPAAKDTLEQLNRILPLPERTKGRALAILMAKDRGDFAAKPADKPTPKSAAAKPPKPAAAKPPRIAAQPAETPAPKPVVQPARVAGGSWRIQLGAFSQRSSAEALYRKLSGKAALAGRHAYYIPVGAVTRLQVGPFESKAAAAAACGALGQACFPVAGK